MDLLKSILEGNGIECVLQDEYMGTMRPYAVLGGIKLLVAKDNLHEARKIVEDFIKDSTT